MATHCGTLAWEIPRTEEPGGSQTTGQQNQTHDSATTMCINIHPSQEVVILKKTNQRGELGTAGKCSYSGWPLGGSTDQRRTANTASGQNRASSEVTGHVGLVYYTPSSTVTQLWLCYIIHSQKSSTRRLSDDVTAVESQATGQCVQCCLPSLRNRVSLAM